MFSAIKKSEGEHAVEVVDAVFAPFFVCVNDNLGVGPGVEVIPESFQLDAHLLKVVNLSVVGDHHVTALVRHRLMTGGRKVNDCETAMAEPDGPIRVVPFAVRPAMGNDVGHALEQANRNRFAAKIANSCNATHKLFF